MTGYSVHLISNRIKEIESESFGTQVRVLDSSIVVNRSDILARIIVGSKDEDIISIYDILLDKSLFSDCLESDTFKDTLAKLTESVDSVMVKLEKAELIETGVQLTAIKTHISRIYTSHRWLCSNEYNPSNHGYFITQLKGYILDASMYLNYLTN
jgi:hypothetical protein